MDSESGRSDGSTNGMAAEIVFESLRFRDTPLTEVVEQINGMIEKRPDADKLPRLKMAFEVPPVWHVDKEYVDQEIFQEIRKEYESHFLRKEPLETVTLELGEAPLGILLEVITAMNNWYILKKDGDYVFRPLPPELSVGRFQFPSTLHDRVEALRVLANDPEQAEKQTTNPVGDFFADFKDHASRQRVPRFPRLADVELIDYFSNYLSYPSYWTMLRPLEDGWVLFVGTPEDYEIMRKLLPQ